MGDLNLLSINYVPMISSFGSKADIFGCDAVTALLSVFDVCCPVVSNVISRLTELQAYSVHWSNLFYSTLSQPMSEMINPRSKSRSDLGFSFKSDF